MPVIKTMQTVSVIMPCFNHAQFIRESADSILGQTHADLELVIVDDCSTDTSWEVISGVAAGDSRVRIIRHERNQGLTQSRNDALAVARGEWIAFCDSDDVWETNKLTVQLGLLRDTPGYDAVYSDTTIIDENGCFTGRRFSELFPPPNPPSGWLFPDLVLRNFINIPSVLMRRKCFETVGPFDDDLKWIQDWWYWLKLSRSHQWLYSSEPVARYRIHGGSTNLVHKRAYSANRWKAFRRILQDYGDLSASAKADINYEMGIDLRKLGKHRWSRRFFWNSLKLSASHPCGMSRFCKASVRIALSATPARERPAHL